MSRSEQSEDGTSGPIHRTRSLPNSYVSGSFGSGLRRTSTSTSSDGNGRRRPSASNWLRSLGQKLTGGSSSEQRRHSVSGDRPIEISGSSNSRRNSTSSTFPTISESPGRRLSTSSQGPSLRQRFRSNSNARQTSIEVDPTDPAPTNGNRPRTSSDAIDPKDPMKPPKRKNIGKHVGFAPETFADDPPQRIPPIRPRKGNVEFLSSGELQVKPRPKSSMDAWYHPYLEKNHFNLSQTALTRAVSDAEKLHSSLGKTGLFSALHHDLGSSNGSVASSRDEEDEEDAEMELERSSGFHSIDPKLDIDAVNHTAIPRHRQSEEEEYDDSDMEGHVPAIVAEIPPPDVVYTRCCHLREIMPIRNMMKQLQGQLAPVPSLRIANTRPTLIEVLAFSDFLTAVPVVSLSLDNQLLGAEMVRLILAGLRRSRDLGRLSFVNTRLESEAWGYLCEFLATHKGSLICLDISCTNPTPLGDKIPAFDRRDVDWASFTQALKANSSLEELVLDGTKISTAAFADLINTGFPQGRVLGVANNDFDSSDVHAVVKWANAPESRVVGLGLSGNDLSREWPTVQQLLTNTRLFRLSLRETQLSVKQAQQFTNLLTADTASKLNLRQLDLSGNPNLFPQLLPRLVETLPKFPFLARLQLDNCALSSEDIVVLADSLAHCHRLVSLSVQGNCELSETACVALCVAVHVSGSIVTVDADTARWPSQIQQRLAKYCLQNLEAAAGPGSTSQEDEEHADIVNFRDEVKAVTSQVASAGPEITEQTMERVVNVRNRVRERMQVMLRRKAAGPLSVADREALVRLFFFDSSLDRLYLQCAAMTGSHSLGLPSREEQVSRMGEEDMRPSLSRKSSFMSLQSLKMLEHEEGAVHKINTAISRSGEPLSSSESVDEIVRRVRKLQAQDLEKIIN